MAPSRLLVPFPSRGTQPGKYSRTVARYHSQFLLHCAAVVLLLILGCDQFFLNKQSDESRGRRFLPQLFLFLAISSTKEEKYFDQSLLLSDVAKQAFVARRAVRVHAA